MISEEKQRPRLITASYGRQGSHWVKEPATVAPRYNEPRYNEDPVITDNI